MGSFGAGLASIGGAFARARELQRQQRFEDVQLAMEQEKLKGEQAQTEISRQYADIAGQRQRLEQARFEEQMRQAGLPHFEGFTTSGNELIALSRDPRTNALSVARFPIDPELGKTSIAALDNLLSTVKNPLIKRRMRDVYGIHAAMGDLKGGLTAAQAELGRMESEEAAANRQTKSQQFQAAQAAKRFEERKQLSATLYNATRSVTPLNEAIRAVNTILGHGNMLNDLLKAAKIEITIDPQGTMQSLLARGVSLNDQESEVASAFAVLTEHINLLRQPLGAQGFRGPEAFARLQAQRGIPLANPRVTLRVLDYTLRNLEGLQRANKRILGEAEFNRQLAEPEDEGGGVLDLQPEQ